MWWSSLRIKVWTHREVWRPRVTSAVDGLLNNVGYDGVELVGSKVVDGISWVIQRHPIELSNDVLNFTIAGPGTIARDWA